MNRIDKLGVAFGVVACASLLVLGFLLGNFIDPDDRMDYDHDGVIEENGNLVGNAFSFTGLRKKARKTTLRQSVIKQITCTETDERVNGGLDPETPGINRRIRPDGTLIEVKGDKCALETNAGDASRYQNEPLSLNFEGYVVQNGRYYAIARPGPNEPEGWSFYNVQEWWCDGSRLVSQIMSCPQGKQCTQGACR